MTRDWWPGRGPGRCYVDCTVADHSRPERMFDGGPPGRPGTGLLGWTPDRSHLHRRRRPVRGDAPEPDARPPAGSPGPAGTSSRHRSASEGTRQQPRRAIRPTIRTARHGSPGPTPPYREGRAGSRRRRHRTVALPQGAAPAVAKATPVPGLVVRAGRGGGGAGRRGVGLVVTIGATDHTTAKAAAAPPPPSRRGRWPTCPLTGAPAPGGVVPARPALGVKIGNYPGDRPSAGLNQADIVFEEPVEGAITRLVAVFQCRGASLVGDLRSAREPDVAILSQLSTRSSSMPAGSTRSSPCWRSAPLTDENLLRPADHGRPSSSSRDGWRPYSTFVNTASLWAFDPSDTTPPAPIFHYSDRPARRVGGRLGGQRAHPVLVDAPT